MKISDVSKIFDIPQETLRYIEQRGLVHPVRNQENGYREYDLPAFSELVEYMRLRNMGLSINSVSKIYNEGTLDTLYQEVFRRQQALEREISYTTLLKNYLDAYLAQMETMQDNIGLFHFEKRKPVLYVHVGKGIKDQYEYQDSKTATQWRKYVPFVSLGYRFSTEQIADANWETKWVFSVDEMYARALNLKMDSVVMRDDGGICLTGYISYYTWNEAQNACREAARFAQRHGYEVAGDSSVVFMMQQLTGAKRMSIVRLNMPLRKA